MDTNRFFKLARRSCWVALLAIATPIWVQAQGLGKPSIGLPIHVKRQPPSDLLSAQGQPLDPGAAISLAERGVDLSALNPAPSKLWQNRSYPAAPAATEDLRYGYPSDGGTVRFVRQEATNDFTYMARVEDPASSRYFYRFTLSRNTHATLLRTALMRALGYYVPAPRFYTNLTVSFSSRQEMDEFITAAQEYVQVDFTGRGWLTRRDDTAFTLTFSNATLEPALSEYFDAHWGFLPPARRAFLPLIQQLSRYRAYRALIVPLVLTDMDESVNRFSPKVRTGVINDQVVLTHASARSLAAATYEDARWLVRRLARLDEAELRRIVAEGRFPAEIDELVYRKLVYRIHNMMELFAVSPQADLPKPPLRYDSPSGLIRQGIVTRETVPGYPQRFAHGDRRRPFEQGDLQRYLKIEAITTALKSLLDKANEYLEVRGPGDLALARQEELQKRIAEHIRKNPREPLYQKLESWGGPIGSAALSASRHVTTGTYFESTAPIQLIDDLTISGSLGYFRALDGYANVMPTAGGNVTLLRSYTHVRPIASIEEGAREKWQNLFVAKFMKDLGKVLEQEPPVPGAPAPGEGEEPRRHPLDEFLSGLKEGEVFTITDTLAGGANLQGMSPISALAGLAPLNFVNTLSVGVDASLVGLRQTVFLKTSTGLQVLVRGMTNQAAGAQLDSNFFLNLLHARASLTNSDIATDAYVIDYNTDLSLLAGDDRTAGGEPDPKLERLRKRRQDLQSALRLLFKKNDSSLFESAFADRRFELDHELKTRAFNFKFLTERMNTFSESHELKLRYPVNPDYPELNPADEEVTLYSYKKGELVGRDLLGFLFDLVEGLAERPGTIARVDNPNPANTPFGKAYWRIVNTESDLTTNAGPPGAPNAAYPSVGIIQHVWGGWNLKHDALMKLVAEISARIPQNELGSYRIVEPEFFATTQSLDYYRITQNLSILQGGMDRLRDLVLQPSAGKKGDRAFFKDLMKLLGDGDALLGERIYVENCQAELRARAVEAGLVTSQVRISGNSYECLSPWTQDLLRMRRTYSVSDRRAQTEWMTELLGTLEANIPLSQLLGYIDRSNYSFSVRFNGFRTGDEDGDLEFVSNTSGDPARDFDTSNGLFQLYANKTGITPVELDRSNGSFR